MDIILRGTLCVQGILGVSPPITGTKRLFKQPLIRLPRDLVSAVEQNDREQVELIVVRSKVLDSDRFPSFLIDRCKQIVIEW